MKGDFHIKEYVLFHIHRDIVNFYKTYLNLTQDLQRDHYILLKKVEERTDADFAKNIDYFDSDKYNYIRKKVLDAGNEITRDIEKYFELIDMELNMKKLNEHKEIRLSNLKAFSKSVKIEGGTGKKTKVKGKLI
tara:strand:- start:785 stop:1186 length:402 start_codon:yes stop_codon:yes gene_type:complete